MTPTLYISVAVVAIVFFLIMFETRWRAADNSEDVACAIILGLVWFVVIPLFILFYFFSFVQKIIREILQKRETKKMIEREKLG